MVTAPAAAVVAAESAEVAVEIAGEAEVTMIDERASGTARTRFAASTDVAEDGLESVEAEAPSEELEWLVDDLDGSFEGALVAELEEGLFSFETDCFFD